MRRPRVRDRAPDAGGSIRFTSSILPPYLRRARSIEALLPWLYLKGVSTGDFGEALAALLGPDAPGLPPTTIARLKAAPGRMSTNVGRGAISRPSVTSISGPMASTSHRASIMTSSACW